MNRSLHICFCLVWIFAAFPTANTEAESFKVGIILALTGPWSEFGEAQKNAFELARQDAPDDFRAIEFLYEDGGHQGSQTLSAYQKLRYQDKVNLVFVWGVLPAEVVAPLAERDKLPVLASAQVASVAKDRRYVMRTINYSEQYSRKLLEFLRAQNAAHIGLVQAELSFYQLLADGIRTNLRQEDSFALIDSVVPESTDFRSIVAKTKRGGFDWVGLFLTPPQILEFLRQSAEQGLKTKFFGTTPFQSDSLIIQAAGRLDGAVYVHNFVDPSFRSRYFSKFGNDHQIPWAANAYDAARLVGRLFSRAGASVTADEIVKKLWEIEDGEGAGGHYSIRNSAQTGRYLEYPLSVYKIENGRHLVVSY